MHQGLRGLLMGVGLMVGASAVQACREQGQRMAEPPGREQPQPREGVGGAGREEELGTEPSVEPEEREMQPPGPIGARPDAGAGGAGLDAGAMSPGEE